MAIWLPKREVWTRQPDRPIEIDWSNPLARGLAFAMGPGQEGPTALMFDYVRGRFGPIQCSDSNHPVNLEPRGDAISWGRSGDNSIGNVDATLSELGLGWPAGRSKISVCSFGWLEETGSNTNLRFRISSNLDNQIVSFSGSQVVVRFSSAASWAANDATVTRGAGPFTYGWTWNGADGARMFADGKFLRTVTTNANSVTTTGTAAMSFDHWPHRWFLDLGWDRVLADHEMIAVQRNPWQIFL